MMGEGQARCFRSKQSRRCPKQPSWAAGKVFISPLPTFINSITWTSQIPHLEAGEDWALPSSSTNTAGIYTQEVSGSPQRKNFSSRKLQLQNDCFMFKLMLMVPGGRWLRCITHFPPWSSCLRHPASAIKPAPLYYCRNLFFMSLAPAWWFLV